MYAYKKMYLGLFNRVTDAIAALEKGELSEGISLLKLAQQEAEEIFMEESSNED